MRILYHFRTQGTGAEGVHIAGVANAFEQLGHEVQFISPTGTDPRRSGGENPFARKRRGLLGTLAAHAPGFVFEMMEIAYNFVARRRIAARLAREKFDFIYERHAFFLDAAASASRDLPLVIEVNELAGDERIRATPWLLPLARRADRHTFARASAIITVSPHLKRRIESLGVAAEKIRVIPNAVSDDFLNAPNRREEIRARLGLADATIVGFIGWFVDWHRLDRLIAEFAKVALADASLRLMLVGDGPLRDALTAQAAQLGIADRLVWPGPVPHGDVPAWLDAMDIAVVPHSNEFRSPIKLFEAMARARAVIAPRTEAIASIVSDGEDALLFDPESAAELGARLATPPTLRAQLGAAARTKIAAHHTWRRNAERVLAALRR
ncbi:MAG: glycosyltransferase family 4 protein [Chthoniobacteraceae bacterium]